MENTISGIVDSSESYGSDVTTIETVTVCTFDRRKGHDQTPRCTIRRVRILDKPLRRSDKDPKEKQESPTPVEEDNQTVSTGTKDDRMCPLPTKEMTSEEQEAAMIDCMCKANDKESGVTTPAGRNLDRNERKRLRPKGD
jgi:hypothetical protein